MSGLPEIPVRDYRHGGLLAYAADHREKAVLLMETVIRGMGVPGRLARRLLPAADRVAARQLARMGDPYRAEIMQLPRLLGRPGPVAFALSYEFGCTAKAFPGGRLFRTLDWPFLGLGELVEIVRLPGQAGDWVTATWPGVMGTLHGAAPGRFCASLNQAPERTTPMGRPVNWLWGKWRVAGSRGLPPPHLLRHVLETAPDYAAARRVLTETPVAAPVIFTLAGPDAACVIERTETRATVRSEPSVAANHFEDAPEAAIWRPRGHDSHGRAAQAKSLEAPPGVAGLEPPILNPLTRLAVSMDMAGRLEVAGYEGARRVTEPGMFAPA